MSTEIRIKGYTLLEIVLVVNIIWIALLPIYPLVDKQYQHLLLEQEAHKFVEFLEDKRQEAVLHSPQWSLDSVASPIVTIYNDKRPHAYGISQGTKNLEKIYLPETIGITSNIHEDKFIFNRFGGVNIGGTVEFTNDWGQSKEIVVHLFTGVVKIED